MKSRAGLIREYEDYEFVLQETNLRKMVEVLTTYGKKLHENPYVEFLVEQEDDTFFETQDIETILGYDNAIGRSITHLSFQLRHPIDPETHPKKESYKSLATLLFSVDKEPRVRFSVSGDSREWCVIVADEVAMQISRCVRKRWLRLKANASMDLALLITMFGLITVGLIVYFSSQPPSLTDDQISAMTMAEQLEILLKRSVSNEKLTTVWTVPMGIFLMSVVAALVDKRPLSLLLRKINRSVFLWGDMIPVYRQYEAALSRWKWGVGVAFLISVIASVVSTLLIRT